MAKLVATGPGKMLFTGTRAEHDVVRQIVAGVKQRAEDLAEIERTKPRLFDCEVISPDAWTKTKLIGDSHSISFDVPLTPEPPGDIDGEYEVVRDEPR